VRLFAAVWELRQVGFIQTYNGFGFTQKFVAFVFSAFPPRRPARHCKNAQKHANKYRSWAHRTENVAVKKFSSNKAMTP